MLSGEWTFHYSPTISKIVSPRVPGLLHRLVDYTKPASGTDHIWIAGFTMGSYVMNHGSQQRVALRPAQSSIRPSRRPPSGCIEAITSVNN